MLLGNRLKAVLLLYQGGDNHEKKKIKGNIQSGIRSNFNMPLKVMNHLQQIM